MTIKDVEKITGLSARSIRYYEEKGLISVERNDDNQYRSYNEDDVKALKLIKILRYLDISIEKIEDILKSDNLKKSLKEKQKEYEEISKINEEKKIICEALIKDINTDKKDNVIDDYCESIEYLESDEVVEVKKNIFNMLCPNMTALIINIIIFMAPILSLFIYIDMKRYDLILPYAIVSIICTILIVLEITNYIEWNKKYKSTIKEKNKKNSMIIPVQIVAIVLCIMLNVLGMYLIDKLMLPSNYLFYETSMIPTMLLIFLEIFLIFSLEVFILNKFRVNKVESLKIYSDIWKYKYIIIVISVLIIYSFVSTINVVTEDKIIYRNIFNPVGNSYEYDDVEKIETGFGSKTFSLYTYDRKGEFYYKVFVDDKVIVFSVPTPNEDIKRYYDDTYLELEEFDVEIMKYNPKKVSDDSNYKYCNLDKTYCDRFKRIINNKEE